MTSMEEGWKRIFAFHDSEILGLQSLNMGRRGLNHYRSV